MRNRNSRWIWAVAGLVAIVGCAKKEAPAPAPAPVAEEMAVEAVPRVAKAMLQSRTDTSASGWVTFTQSDAGVDIESARCTCR
jgi:hypothetical protein